MFEDEYTRGMVLACLLNWGEVDASTHELLVVVRCDLRMALARLSGPERIIANTLLSEGDGAFGSRAVTEGEAGLIVERLLEILNVEGLD